MGRLMNLPASQRVDSDILLKNKHARTGEIPFKSENEGLMFYQLSKRCMIKHCSSRSSLQNK